MEIESLINIILGEAIHVHKSIGPGMLENVYKKCLVHRLEQKGIKIQVERAIPVFFEDIQMECGYRADIVVEDQLVIEIKCVEAINDIHLAQVLTYLRFLKIRHGVILNFYTVYLKDGIRRVLNGY